MQNILSLAVGRTHDVHRVTTPWDESSVTWNTMPAFQVGVGDTITVPLVTGCVDFDVTVDVQVWVQSVPNEGLLVMDSAEGAGALTAVEYAARNFSPNSQRPTLTVTYTD
jgi:hypothetical protein